MRSMQRKGFHNKQLHKHTKEHRKNGFPQWLGEDTGLKDKFNQKIHIGDLVCFYLTKNNYYYGRVFYDQAQKEYVLAWGQWYGVDEYSLDSYGKSIILPADNGGRMHVEIIRNY